MSIRVMSWALRDAPVTRHSDLLVLIVIADHAHDDGRGAYPNEATIAKLARMTERCVCNSIARLEAAGVLAVERSPGRVNVYTVLTPERGSGVTPERGSGDPRTSRQGTPERRDTNPRTAFGGTVRTVKEPSGEPARASAREPSPRKSPTGANGNGNDRDFSRFDRGVHRG